MLKTQRIRHLRKTSGFNIFVLLMSLLVFNGHCAAAYASANALPELSDETVQFSMMDHDSGHHQHHQLAADDCCMDMHSDDPSSTLITSSSVKYKSNVDDLKPLLALMTRPPEPRAGPVYETHLSSCSADFVGPHLYYSLCVLRL